MLQKKKFSKEEAILKAKHYCAYQERSHREVRDKLYSFGLYKSEVEQVITLLIEENYLNEERFAIQFAGGKFRVNHWGKIKIRYELQQKGVSAYCVKKALAAIEEADYQAMLLKLATAKAGQLSAGHPLSRKAKLQAYLLQKGYEPGIVLATVNRLVNSSEQNSD